jgi:hypothetical protein
MVHYRILYMPEMQKYTAYSLGDFDEPEHLLDMWLTDSNAEPLKFKNKTLARNWMADNLPSALVDPQYLLDSYDELMIFKKDNGMKETAAIKHYNETRALQLPKELKEILYTFSYEDLIFFARDITRGAINDMWKDVPKDNLLRTVRNLRDRGWYDNNE